MTRPTEPPPASEDRGPRAEIWLLWVALALGVALRVGNALRTSLWLDDFHSLHHARNLARGDLWTDLLRDNHPPLSFVLLGAARMLGGEGELVLALPAIVAGLLGLIVLWLLLEGFPGRGLAVLLLASSTLHLEASANLRMYALLALGVLGFLLGLRRVLEDRGGVLCCVAFATVGFHAHYQFVHAFGLAALLAVGGCLLRRDGRPPFPRLLVALATSVLCALPWGLFGLRAQLGHELAPGGSQVSLARLLESVLHLLFHGVGDHGDGLRTAFLVGAGCTAVLALFGILGLVGPARPPEARAATSLPGFPARVLVVGFACLLPVWIAAAAWLQPRSGFDWRYLIGASGPFAAVVAAGAALPWLPAHGVRRALTATSLGTLLVLAALTVRHRGHEDYATATDSILSELAPGDAVLAVDWQPRLFPHGIGWEYYAGRAAPERSRANELRHTDDFRLLEPPEAASFDRVFCLLRSVPNEVACLEHLRTLFATERARAFGRGLYVVTFSDRR